MPQPPAFDPVRGHRGRPPARLPAEGRSGPAPTWPLDDGPTPAEIRAWEQAWRTPQAVAWERLGWTRTVAQYCRVAVRAENPGATAALLGQATVLEDRLGLTPKALRMLLWEIAPDDVAERRATTRGARGRVKAVDRPRT